MKKEFQDKAAKKAYRKAILALVRKYENKKSRHSKHKKDVVGATGEAIFDGLVSTTCVAIAVTMFPPAILGAVFYADALQNSAKAVHGNAKNKKYEWTTDRGQKVKGHVGVAIALDVAEKHLTIAADDMFLGKKTGDFYDKETPEQAVKRLQGEIDLLITAVEVTDGSGPYQKPEISKKSTIKKQRFKI